MPVQAILFDLDNTLTDRRKSIANYAGLFAFDFADQLNAITPDDLEHIMQVGDGGGYRPKAEMFAELAAVLPWKIPVSAADLRDHWYAVSPMCMHLRNGLRTVTVLTEIKRRGIRLGIVTNGQTEVQLATFHALHIDDLIATVIVSEAAGIKKPTPKIFHLALRELGVNAADSWFVGDHPLNDVGGASAAGLTGIWLNPGDTTWPSEYPKPIFEIYSLHELIGLLDS